MAKDNKKKARDKAAEKAVKARLGGTHLKSFRILGSEKDPDICSESSASRRAAVIRCPVFCRSPMMKTSENIVCITRSLRLQRPFAPQKKKRNLPDTANSRFDPPHWGGFLRRKKHWLIELY